MPDRIKTKNVTFIASAERVQPCFRSLLTRHWGWWAGAALVAVHLAIFLLSSQFNTNRALADRPVLWLVGLEMFAGVIWLTAIWLSRRSKETKVDMFTLILVGVILRGMMLFSTPMLEDDFWRYLWDGAVVAHGYSPYTQAPQEFLTEAENANHHHQGLYALAREGHGVLEHINHPSLRTIYPPLAQATFAAAHLINPWSLSAWRMVLLAFDIASFMLILRLLRDFGLPAMGAVIYWWNPLLIKESVNAAHMDLLVLPFVLGALLLACRKKPIWAIAIMSLAVGVKLWPVILLPFLFRPLIGSARRCFVAIGVAVSVLAFVTWPAAYRVLEPNSGFAAYAERWEMNDALFMGLQYGLRIVLGWVELAAFAPVVVRVLIFALLASWIAWLMRRPVSSAMELAERMLLAVAGLFLLSPTQFPWYSLWILPLLTLRPRRSLLLLMVLLPLFHLRFYFSARGYVTVFDHGIVWLEYLPVWGLLIWEAIQSRRCGSQTSEDTISIGKGGCLA